MKSNSTLQLTLLICLSLLVVLACNMGGTPTGNTPDPSIAETEIQLRVLATSLSIQQMTLEAAQSQNDQQVPAVEPSPQVAPTRTPAPTDPPTQVIQPTPVPTRTEVPPPAELVLDIQTSVDEFYCYQPPYELKITVKVSEINRGMAVYYHIRDKNSGKVSDGQVIDLRRRTNDMRDATIIGGGSSSQNLQFPPMMGESFFVYQIISDDGQYRSPAYSDVTFFPCGQ